MPAGTPAGTHPMQDDFQPDRGHIEDLSGTFPGQRCPGKVAPATGAVPGFVDEDRIGDLRRLKAHARLPGLFARGFSRRAAQGPRGWLHERVGAWRL